MASPGASVQATCSQPPWLLPSPDLNRHPAASPRCFPLSRRSESGPPPPPRSAASASCSRDPSLPHWLRGEQRRLREEQRWLREERRWLRQERRWLREEQRWLRQDSHRSSERGGVLEHSAALLTEVRILKRELRQSKRGKGGEDRTDALLTNLAASVASLLKSLNEIQGLIRSAIPPEASSPNTSAVARASRESDSACPDVLQAASGKSGSELPKVGWSGIPWAGEETEAIKGPWARGEARRLLKRGSEGEDVAKLQEALANIGFYSGEDDVEQSSFASGTERAVKTWQATIGVTEDGIVTTQLLARLFGENNTSLTERSAVSQETMSNTGTTLAATNAFVKRATSYQEPMMENSSSMDIAQKRVYLLGENRWEDPNRVGMKFATTERCFACRGEGQNLCTECEGTGELNVEEQFLEWAGEDTKCPYCEGSGSITCDECDGTGLQTS